MRSLVLFALLTAPLAQAAARQPDAYGVATDACKRFWEKIAVDVSSDDNRMSETLAATSAYNAAVGRPLILPPGANERMKTEVHHLMGTVTLLCDAFAQRRAGAAEWARLEDATVRYGALARRVQDDVYANVQTLLAKPADPVLRARYEAQIGRFTDLWLATGKAWRVLLDATAALQTGPAGGHRDVMTCPAETCVFEDRYCYYPDDAPARALVFIGARPWIWLGESAVGDPANPAGGVRARVARPGSAVWRDVGTASLQPVAATAGACTPAQLGSFDVAGTPLAVGGGLPKPVDATAVPPPDAAHDTTTPAGNSSGAPCPSLGMLHRDARWLDLATGGAQLDECRDGTLVVTDTICVPGYHVVDGACVTGSGTAPTEDLGAGCPAVGLRAHEVSAFDLPLDRTVLPGFVRRYCDNGIARIVGAVCFADLRYQRQGNTCVWAGSGAPASDGRSDAGYDCASAQMNEGDARDYPLPAVAGTAPGARRYTCKDTQLVQSLVCAPGFGALGDACVAEAGPAVGAPAPAGRVPMTLSLDAQSHVVGPVAQVITQIVDTLLGDGALPGQANAPALVQDLSGRWIVAVGGDPVYTEDGELAVLRPADLAVVTAGQSVPVLCDADPLGASLTAPLRLVRIARGPLLKCALTAGGRPFLDRNGAPVWANLTARPLAVGSDVNTPAGAPGSPQNIISKTSDQAITFDGWTGLNQPQPTRPRPPITDDDINIPLGPGQPPASYRPCQAGGQTHAHGTTWMHPITGGNLPYRCVDGTAVGSPPQCNAGFHASGMTCVADAVDCYVPWDDNFHVVDGQTGTTTVPNGKLEVACTHGNYHWTIYCNAGYTPDAPAEHCNPVAGSCTDVNGHVIPPNAQSSKPIPNGTEWDKCVNGGWQLANVQCDAGYTLQSDYSCAPLGQSNCTFNGVVYPSGSSHSNPIPHGETSQLCQNGTWQAVTAACDSGYRPVHLEGWECQSAAPCTGPDGGTYETGQWGEFRVDHGSLKEYCNGGNWGDMTTTCDQGYTLEEGACVELNPSCTDQSGNTVPSGTSQEWRVINGQQEEDCSRGHWLPGRIDCDNGYVLNDGQCVAQGPASCTTQDGRTFQSGDTDVEPVANGRQDWSCNDGQWSGPSMDCNLGFHPEGDQCLTNSSPSVGCTWGLSHFNDGDVMARGKTNNIELPVPCLVACENGNPVEHYQNNSHDNDWHDWPVPTRSICVVPR